LSQRKHAPESDLRRFIRAALDQRFDGFAFSQHTQAFRSLSSNAGRLLLIEQDLYERPNDAAIMAAEAKSVNGTPSSCFKWILECR
jgi:hypothetical protein